MAAARTMRENHADEEKMHYPFAALIRRAEAYQMYVHE